MLKFYYSPKYKYTNRLIINVSNDSNFVNKDYINIDSPDTINGHIIYELEENENLKVPTYIVDTESDWNWFVSGITQLTTFKFQLSLIRDVISENDTWKFEPNCYIQAGTATNYNKYKRWNLPFTNTKIGEQRLNINGKSSFFVYYVNTQSITDGTLTESDLKIKATSIPGITTFDYKVSNLNEIPNFNYVGVGEVNAVKLDSTSLYIRGRNLNTNVNAVGDYWYKVDMDFKTRARFGNPIVDNESGGINIAPSIIDNMGYEASLKLNTNNALTEMQEAVRQTSEEAITAVNYPNMVLESNLETLEPYVNKIILNTTNNKVYKIQKRTNYQGAFRASFGKQNKTANLIARLKGITYPGNQPSNLAYMAGSKPYDETNEFWSTITAKRTKVEYILEELGTLSEFDFNFIANNRKLPKSAVRCVNIVADANTNDEELAQCLMLAQTNGINEKNDTGRILDIQYLPFSIATKTNDNIKINKKPITAEFLIKDSYSFNTNLPDITNINKETDTIKIVSPSRSSQFLFRPYDNDGNMEFSTKITLKPNASIIYVRPSTRGLLINDWDDKNCLIIQEDFSLTNVSSNWTNYIYNNRNYQNTFNRDIQGRAFNRDWERKVEQAQARSDDWTARNISAQKGRTYTGNLPIISGIAAAASTTVADRDYLAAARRDREYNEAVYQESVSLAQDMFKMQLENIQSQPNIPTSITTIDNKLLDGIYLEYYSTNTTELLAIANYYKYNGNRIEDFGNFNDYYGPYVKGKIITSNSYTQPELTELNKRLELGIFTREV